MNTTAMTNAKKAISDWWRQTGGQYDWNAIAEQTGTQGTVGRLSMGLFDSAEKASARQYQYNLALQKQAQQWNEYMYKNRFKFQRQDLENAGINPLFGMGQAPSVTSGTNSVGMPDMVGEQNNKFNQMMSLLDFGQNLSAKRAQTKLIERQAQTEEQNTLLRTAEVLEKQINNKFLPEQRKAELKKMQADTLEALARTNESYASAGLKNAQTARENLELGPIKRYERWARLNPEKARVLESLTDKGKDLELGTALAKKGLGALRFLITK